MFSVTPLGLFWKPSYLTSQSETNRKACESVGISETSEAKKILSLVHRQDHLDNQVSKYASSTHYRLRNPPSAVKHLFRSPGQAWHYEQRRDIRRCSCPKDRYSWLWNNSKQVPSLSWYGTCLLYDTVESIPGGLKSVEENRVSGGEWVMGGLMVKVPTLARPRGWILPGKGEKGGCCIMDQEGAGNEPEKPDSPRNRCFIWHSAAPYRLLGYWCRMLSRGKKRTTNLCSLLPAWR